MRYDLLTEPWIPVIKQDAKSEQLSREKLGLLALFREAESIKEVSHNNPLVVASVYRLCLAILFRTWETGKTSEYKKGFLQGGFDNKVSDYLSSAQCVDKFDLFSKEHPFFQTANFTKDAPSSVKKLSPQFATGNNKTLFSHMHDGDDFSLPPDEAALNLLVCQYFSLGGGISGSSVQYGKHPNFANSPLVGGAVFYITGANLYQTLVLNLRAPDGVSFSQNKAVWELPTPDNLKPQPMQGISHYLTWPSRHIRLLPDEQGQVRQIFLSQGYAKPEEMESEPYFCMRVKNDGKGLVPNRLSFERALWRDSMAVLGFAAGEDSRALKPFFAAGITNLHEKHKHLEKASIKQLNCQVIALDNNKANPLCWFNQRIPVYLRYVQQQYVNESEGTNFLSKLHAAIQQAEMMAAYLKKAVRNVATNILMDGARTEDVSKVVAGLNPEKYYWPQLEDKFYMLYRELAEVDKNDVQEINRLGTKWCRELIEVSQKALLDATQSVRNGTGRSFRAFAYGQKSLAQSINDFWGAQYQSKQERKMQQQTQQCQATKELIALFARFQAQPELYRGQIAQLRRTILTNPQDMAVAYRYLEGRVSAVTDPWFSKVLLLSAGLFAIHKHHRGNASNLGDSLRLLKHTAGFGDSFDDRFQLLLQVEPEQLPVVLRGFFQMLAQSNISVNYQQLITDLKHWHDSERTTQMAWARSFWAPASKIESETESETQSDTNHVEQPASAN